MPPLSLPSPSSFCAAAANFGRLEASAEAVAIESRAGREGASSDAPPAGRPKLSSPLRPRPGIFGLASVTPRPIVGATHDAGAGWRAAPALVSTSAPSASASDSLHSLNGRLRVGGSASGAAAEGAESGAAGTGSRPASTTTCLCSSVNRRPLTSRAADAAFALSALNFAIPCCSKNESSGIGGRLSVHTETTSREWREV